MPTERRRFLKTAAGFWAAPALLGASAIGGAQAADPAAAPVPANFPAFEPGLAKEMVGVSHGNIERVRELLEVNPALAKASWDWGYGDWETAIGAASHVGNREMAALLMEHGARPDIFTFAMLGHLDVVKAYVTAQPGIEKTHGPHGLTLLFHARKGGEGALGVVQYLESLGTADQGYVSVPLADEEKAVLAGDYSFGAGPEDIFRVSQSKDGSLGIVRLPNGTNRALFHLGNHEFHPTGNSSARIRFKLEGGTVQSLVVENGADSLAATRITG